MLSGYAKNGRFYDSVDVFEAMPEKNVVSYNAMLSGYLGIGDFMSARKMFDEMGERNVASWNAMINGYVKVGTFQAIRASQVLFWHVQTLETLSHAILKYLASAFPGVADHWLLNVEEIQAVECSYKDQST
ncbi:hypothetical protein T459_14359 [Capsicum annuum]|uniref:Pentatricopeptide repeat-containing protein n=1 Tax=Capsicum annuum TaxID=4072 RepID=A0A2G2ZHC7_CAPAN|nr:hypothetical protein T459_14359 [Capsicum annuum]